MLKIEDLYIGRVDARKYGYKRGTLKVTVDIEISQENGTRWQTTEHAEIVNPLRFSMSAAVWNQRETDHVAGGQAREVLTQLVTFADGFDADKAAQLTALWERWHLNTMRAGCAHQGAPVYRDGQYGREIDFAATPQCPLALGMVKTGEDDDGNDIVQEVHYRYGSAWLTEPLPEGFEDTVIDNLPDRQKSWSEQLDRADNDSPSLADLMRRDGIKSSAARKAHRLDEPNPDGTRWSVSFRRPGAEKSFSVTYHLGSGHGDRRPTGLEVLSTVLDEARTFRNAEGGTDLASEFGMELDEAKKLYRKLEVQKAGVRRFLGDKYEEYAELD